MTDKTADPGTRPDAKRTTYDELTDRLLDLNAWACAHGVAVIAFAVLDGQIVTLDHVSCPVTPIAPNDSRVAQKIVRAMIPAVRAVGQAEQPGQPLTAVRITRPPGRRSN